MRSLFFPCVILAVVVMAVANPEDGDHKVLERDIGHGGLGHRPRGHHGHGHRNEYDSVGHHGFGHHDGGYNDVGHRHVYDYDVDRHHHHHINEPSNFEYKVQDPYHGASFGHEEYRDGYVTKGTYYVDLPDGRRQTVTYTADEYGYHPVVTYEGEAQYGYGVSDEISLHGPHGIKGGLGHPIGYGGQSGGIGLRGPLGIKGGFGGPIDFGRGSGEIGFRGPHGIKGGLGGPIGYGAETGDIGLRGPLGIKGGLLGPGSLGPIGIPGRQGVHFG